MMALSKVQGFDGFDGFDGFGGFDGFDGFLPVQHSSTGRQQTTARTGAFPLPDLYLEGKWMRLIWSVGS